MALKLTMTCGPYDRAQALINGSVKPEGIDLEIMVNSDDAKRQQFGRDGAYDICEFYTGTYIADLPYRSLGYTAIPIFVKRMHRHCYMYVNKNAGIRSAKDLAGRRVGIQNWFTTTALWGRAILEDEYGVDLKSITWVSERKDRIGAWQPPDWLKVDFVQEGTKLHDRIIDGSIDAAITTGLWAPFDHPDIDFLFPNHAQLEREYYKKSGFFPIMHTLLIKSSVLEQHPWVAMSMYNAWQESKQRCYEWLQWQRIHQTALWYRALWEEEQVAGGPDFYAWGLKESRAELDYMIRRCLADGIIPRKFEPEDMFHPSTLDT